MCRAGRVVADPPPMKEHCTSGKPVSSSARPWYDVLAAACNLRSRLSRDTRARATALAASREEAQNASFPRARAVPGGPCSAQALQEGTAPAGSLSSTVRNRGTTCQRQPPLCAPGFHVTCAHAPLRSLSLTTRRSTQAFRARAPCRAGCDRLIPDGRALHQRKASLLRCETVVRRASCGLHFAQPVFAWPSERTASLAVSQEDAQHVSFLRARPVPRWL